MVDLLYFMPESGDRMALEALRLSRLAELDLDLLGHFARATGKPKLVRALAHIEGLAAAEQEWVTV